MKDKRFKVVKGVVNKKEGVYLYKIGITVQIKIKYQTIK